MNHTLTPTGDAAQELAHLENAITDQLFQLQPSYAVFLGLHQYDGRVPVLTREATDLWLVGADRLLSQLRAIPEEKLAEARKHDRLLLELLIESSRFDLQESHDLDRNPMSYVGSASLTAYMVREYAPLSQRVEAMVHTLNEIPRLLRDGLERLDPTLPQPFVRLALSIGGGLPGHFAEAEALATHASPHLGERFREARVPAETALGAFLRTLEEECLPRATPEFALGPAKYQRLLWVREGIRTPFAEVAEAGWRDLRRNQARLAEVAAHEDPPRTIAECLEELYRDHPSSNTLIEEARRFVDETRRFVEERELATVPPEARCRVEETPVYGRALSTASMNPPGPYDVAGDEGIYFVTPVDLTWSPAKQEEWLRSLNRPMLRNITAHEVYPGHYLQFLHFRKGADSTARRVYLSSSFAEGWAHYCEQLTIEQGMGSDDDGRAEVAQLHDALLRDCRLLSSVGLHTGGMTLAQSAQLFQQQAHMEALPAEREAIRGTFNPEYFCYTLGKLAILEARNRYLAGMFHGSLKGFHDRLLSFGCPPVGLLDRLFGAT
jgi:hypothetical protein